MLRLKELWIYSYFNLNDSCFRIDSVFAKSICLGDKET
jgi:hypothetical protein